MSANVPTGLVDLRHRRPSSPLLAGALRGLVAVRVAGTRELLLHTVPHGSLVLSLQLGTELGSHEPSGLAWLGSALTGLRSRAVSYLAKPGTLTVVALLSPVAVHRLLSGLPTAELVGRRLALDELLAPTVVRALASRVRDEWESDPLATLEAWLMERLCAARRPRALSAWRAFRAHELVRAEAVSDLTTLLGTLDVSRRQLERDCAAYLGLGPAQLFAQRRLQRALRSLRSSVSLAGSAADAGFADQAHMAHVFQRSMGRSPSAWASLPLTRLGSSYLRASGGELVTG